MAISSRLALWEQKIKEEERCHTPSSPPILPVVPGGFIKQLVRETEKEAKTKEKVIKEEKQAQGKLSDDLIQNFAQLIENEITPADSEMANNNQALIDGPSNNDLALIGGHRKDDSKAKLPRKHLTLMIKDIAQTLATNEKATSLISPEPETIPIADYMRDTLYEVIELKDEQMENEISLEDKLQETVETTSEPGTIQGKDDLKYKDSINYEAEQQNKEQVEMPKSDMQEDMWYETEKVWFVHKDGFTLATELKPDVGTPELPEGKAKIRLDSTEEIMIVDEEDIHRTNPSKLDYAEDLSLLISLNESSVINTLQHRYQSQLIHTFAGPHLVAIKPTTPISSFSGKVFKGKKTDQMPPHIYAVAQRAYWNMLTHRQDQTIIPMGRSGSGKTTNCQNVLEYLVNTAGNEDKKVTGEKIQAMFTVLKAFGGVTTNHSTNSTRFSMIMALDFSQAGRVAAAHLQTMLLERIRVAQRPEGESTFNVFYQMLAGLDMSTRTELHLHQMAESNAFGIEPVTKTEEKQKASAAFALLVTAMEVLGFTMNEQRAIWHVLAAIYHLGAAGTCKVGRKQFMKFEWAQNAAAALGCEFEELSTAVFKHHLKQIIEQVTAGVNRLHQEGEASTGPKMTGVECLEGMAAGLYEELFAIIVSLINRSFASNGLPMASVLVVDTPGFHNPRHQNKERASTFEELCHNYMHERLQTLFFTKTFVSELEIYKEENIDVPFDVPEFSPAATVSVIDQVTPQFKIQPNGQTEEPKGLLWILDEEAITQGSNDNVVLDRLCSYFETKKSNEDKEPIRRCEQALNFEINHQLGKDPVRYDLTGWINKAKPNLSAQNASQLLQDSNLDIVKNLFKARCKIPLICRSVAGLEGNFQHSLQRVGCVRKTFTSSFAAVKKMSVCAQIKLQVDALINVIKRSHLHFVHCLISRQQMDVPDVRMFQHKTAGAVEGKKKEHKTALEFDIPAVRTQLWAMHLLDALRLYRIGYSDHMVLRDFRCRFQVLAPPIMKQYGSAFTTIDERKAVEELLLLLDLEKKSIILGQHHVFLKPGVLAQLERQREKLVVQTLIIFQAVCKGFLARQKFKTLKIQGMAIRCIKKNLTKFLLLKDWSWWKVLCALRPLLDINIADERLRAKEEEILMLRRKLEKSEKERNEIRQSSDLLESKITDLTAELTDERFKSEVACLAMEAERAERLRLTREIKELQAKHEQVQKNLESVEKQLEETHQRLHIQQLESSSSGGEDEWRIRFECSQTEIDFLRKRLTQFEERMEYEFQYRKELEEKLTSLQSAYDTAKLTVQQLKRKCKHLINDLEDTRVLMESQQSRNHALEKKQNKFDMQLAQALGESSFEKSLREKVTQENTTIRGEMYKLQLQMEEKDSSAITLNQKLKELEAQVKDLSSSGSMDQNYIPMLKKQLRELETTVEQQNKELNEQEGTIQQLEQMHLRFEMELQRMKQIHLKELEDKEEELEDIRQSCQRKLRQLEMQLEQEFEERQLVLHEKQDLEGLIATLCEQIGHRDFDVEKRLRRDLKRTHALLADAQLLLATMDDPSQSANKEEIEKLRAQLEDSVAQRTDDEKIQKSLIFELESIRTEMETISRNKKMVDEQLYQLQHERADLLKQIEEDQEDLNELMKKHKALIAQSSNDITQIRELQAHLEEANKEKQSLKEKMQISQSRIEYLENSMVERSIVSRQEAIICDLENKLEYQKAQIKRYEFLILRLRDNVIKMGEELEKAADAEAREKENAKYYQMRMQEMKMEVDELAERELEANHRRIELEMRVEELSSMRETLQADLETSIKRIADLQAALEEEEDEEESSDETDMERCDSERDNQSSLGSFVSDEDGTRSWVSVSLGLRSPSGGSIAGSSIAGSHSRQSATSNLSVHSFRSHRENKNDDLSRTSSSLSKTSSKWKESESVLDKTDLYNKSRRPLDVIEENIPKRKSPPAEDRSTKSSLALSEFLEELRRKQMAEKEQASLVLEDSSVLPIYQTTGVSSLRRRTSVKDEDEDTTLQFGNKGLNESQENSSNLTRSVSLRSIPSETSNPTLSPAVKRMTRFGSCESLLHPQSTSVPLNSILKLSPAPVRKITSPRLKPLRHHPELTIEEDDDSRPITKPLVFQNKCLGNLTDEDKETDHTSWKIPSLSYERKRTEDFDDILPAIKRAQSASNLARSPTEARAGRRPLSVHFGDLSLESPSSLGAFKRTPLKESPEELANLSDSSSSSGSIFSCKSADSIKSQPKMKKSESEGHSEAQKSKDCAEEKQSEGDREEKDVNTIMMKYLQKPEK
ncbi:unconventional myosin-XVIIIb isoform X2 [Protopterus annectens]|uniref:unconventional myosin-XVIIIb isoform X2 n=1 Tax=Protopterus annectens TaxID=7888 RepID=UPI001CFB94F0|nr:unconventional myosin-XVIIIb isoform X2 [Protopterus annectens]